MTFHSGALVAATNALRGRMLRRAAIDAPMRGRMYQLLRAHFTGVSPEAFDDDLARKTAVILLEDDDGVVRGFSTLLLYDTSVAGRELTIVYSGDTIVERRWWGSPTLARTWIQGVRALTDSAAGSARQAPFRQSAIQPFTPPRDLYWMLLTSGFRTYRFLPVFYRSFYPCFDQETPADVQATIDAIATAQFGPQYVADAGVVRFARPQVLAPDLLGVPPGRDLDPHVRFFLARNPGHVNGDELVCLTRIHEDNLTPAGRRMMRPASFGERP